MIRMFLLAAGLLSVTIVLLMSQLGDPDEIDGGSAAVTRTDTSALGLTSEPVQTEPRVVRNVPQQAPASETPGSAALGGSQIDMMTQTILQELRKPVTGDRLRKVADQAQGQTDDLRALTDGVLAGLEASADAPTPTQSDSGSPQTLNALIIQAMRQGQSDEYVDALLNEAVGNGEVEAPAAILTPSGEVDTATLLDSLVQQSFAAQGTPTAEPAQDVVGIKPQVKPQPKPQVNAKVRTTAKPAAPVPAIAPASEEDLYYVVQPGDSLAGIALRHYGTTTAHDIIYQANRNRLPSASAVKPGMTLRIPAL